MAYEVLHVQMLGRFAVHYGKNPIIFNKVVSAKSVRLFQILLLDGKEGIPKNELIDSLYGWNGQTDGGNRNRNLNNLLYRLKGQLAAAGLPEEEYVAIRDGICYWESKIPVEIDAVRFEELAIQAMETEGEEKLRLCKKANECYAGELLPMNLTDLWFYGRSIYLKKLFVQVAETLEEEYLKRGDYRELLNLYTHAASIYPFDNWQTSIMRCYLAMYRYDDALNIYNETVEMYAREMGIPPTEEMQECFETLKISEKYHQSNRDLRGASAMDQGFLGQEGNIAKAIFKDNGDSGAYYCTYPSFVDYCRLVVRISERDEIRAVLLFLTLKNTGSKVSGKAGTGKSLSRQMDLLKQAVEISLRRGDAYTRYGSCHYILMMINIEKEACSGVFKRIEKAFNRISGSKGELWYHASMPQELKKETDLA